MERIFTVNSKYGKVLINFSGIKKMITENRKAEAKNCFRVLTKKK